MIAAAAARNKFVRSWWWLVFALLPGCSHSTPPAVGPKSTDELIAVYRDAHKRHDVDAAVKLMYVKGIPAFPAGHFQGMFANEFGQKLSGVRVERADRERFKGFTLPPDLTIVGELIVDFEEPQPRPDVFRVQTKSPVGTRDGIYYIAGQYPEK